MFLLKKKTPNKSLLSSVLLLRISPQYLTVLLCEQKAVIILLLLTTHTLIATYLGTTGFSGGLPPPPLHVYLTWSVCPYVCMCFCAAFVCPAFLGSMPQYMALCMSLLVCHTQKFYLRCFKSDFSAVKSKFGLLIEQIEKTTSK